MGRWRRLIAAFALLAAAALSQAATAQAPAPNSRCAPNNLSCLCSFDCCRQERCSTSPCNQCVTDCVQRKRPGDARSSQLVLRCQGPPDQKARRL